jgi:hypothetical protein
MRAAGLGVLLLLASTPALAAGNGMYLCPTPASANYFWQDTVQAHSLNLPITKDALKRFGEKERCELIVSPDLKPIDFGYNQLLITDGKVKGWAEPHNYIRYVNGSDP